MNNYSSFVVLERKGFHKYWKNFSFGPTMFDCFYKKNKKKLESLRRSLVISIVTIFLFANIIHCLFLPKVLSESYFASWMWSFARGEIGWGFGFFSPHCRFIRSKFWANLIRILHRIYFSTIFQMAFIELSINWTYRSFFCIPLQTLGRVCIYIYIFLCVDPSFSAEFLFTAFKFIGDIPLNYTDKESLAMNVNNT